MSRKYLGIISAIILVIAALIVVWNNDKGVGIGGSDTNDGDEQGTVLDEPKFNNVSVHDPSIIKVDDSYYAFGSHIEAAKSEDLMDWTVFTNGYTTPDNALYGDLSDNLAESFAWAGENDADSQGGFSVWAPEIFWNEHYVNEDGTTGAFMMYYSASSTYIRSAIGFAVSQDIEGPYEHVKTLVYSGFTDHEAYDDKSEVNKQWENTNIADLIDQGLINDKNEKWFDRDGEYNNRDYPNAIDANLFFDEEGRLWMTYGSWSGGIYLLELDKETGEAIYPKEDGETEDGRLIDRYFGTKIAGGYWKSGEGPYVQYNPDNGYYYLYVTYGWLGADGGYHMRQFRSENPEGPYLDAAEQPAVLPGDVDNAQFGNKLFGNFIFERELGEPGMGQGQGYLSSGHNSVYLDNDTNQEFLVFHTRFPNRGEEHELRIHQMFLNKNDWPVVAPKRYAGESLNDQIKTDELVGNYKYINHGKDNSTDLKASQIIELHEDGTVTGAVDGNWEHDGYYGAITINDIVYDGVFVEVWDELAKDFVMSFTALSEKGVSIWGVQSHSSTLSSEEIVDKVEADLSLGNQNDVTDDLSLDITAFGGTTIEWQSSDESIISVDGKVTRPTGEDAQVTLTATIANGDVSKEKTFELNVLGNKEVALIAHYAFDHDLSDDQGSFKDGEVIGDQIDNQGGEITFDEGVKGQAAKFDGNSGILLPEGLIDQEAYTIAFWLNPTELTEHTPAFFGAVSPEQWLSIVPYGHTGNTMVWSGSDEWYDASSEVLIDENEWTHIALTADGDKITLYIDGEVHFQGSNFPNLFDQGSSYFALGVNHWDPAFKGLMDELYIYDGAISATEIQELYQ